MSDMFESCAMLHSGNNAPSLIYCKKQELLSLHLEETENPATNTVFSVALSGLSCDRNIRS